MARRRRALALALALMVPGALTLAACGDDDDDTEASTETTEASEGNGSETADGADAVDVEMVDYGYKVSGALKAGGTLRVSNTSDTFHMIGIGRLKGDTTLEDVTALLQQSGGGEGESEEGSLAVSDFISFRSLGATEEEPAGEEEEDPFSELLEEMGMPGQLMGPGLAADVAVPGLTEGTYALVCFLNVEGEETPHFSKGMIGQLDVVAEEAEAPEEPDETYTLEAGKAIEGPAELKAGRHLFKLDAAGINPGGLEPGLVKLGDGVSIEQFAEALTAFDEAGLPEDAAAKIPGEFIVGLFDYDGNTTVYLGVDLTPGTYILSGQDSDAEDAPDVPVERIEIKVT